MSDWRNRAACLGEDTELFFPISTHPGRQTCEAKAVCHTCPVIDTCLTWALDTRQDYGIWGGRTEDERRTIRRRAARDATKARKVAATPGATRTSAAKVASLIVIEKRCQVQRARVTAMTTQGQPVDEISHRLGISVRTVGRMLAQTRAATRARKAART